jgi:hypothetical protein
LGIALSSQKVVLFEAMLRQIEALVYHTKPHILLFSDHMKSCLVKERVCSPQFGATGVFVRLSDGVPFTDRLMVIRP